MIKPRPTYQELEKRLAVAEPIVEALKQHEVDAVVGEEKIAFLLVKEIGEALLNSEAGFQAMFGLSGVGMIQADTPAFRFTKVNQKFCEMTGYSTQELLARTYIGLTHPGDLQRDMKALARVLRAKTDSWSIEKRCIRKDGSVVWLGVHGAALREGHGRVVRIVAMISDITEAKQREQALRERAEELRRPSLELTLAEQRERQRIARILHDHIEDLLVGVKRRKVPLARGDEKTVRQALKDVQDFIDPSIGFSRGRSAAPAPAPEAKPVPIKKRARIKHAGGPAAKRSSDKSPHKRL